MYLCSDCNNTEYFVELRHLETLLRFGADSKLIHSVINDVKINKIVEIYCSVCKASTEDNMIIDKETGIPVILDN